MARLTDFHTNCACGRDIAVDLHSERTGLEVGVQVQGLNRVAVGGLKRPRNAEPTAAEPDPTTTPPTNPPDPGGPTNHGADPQ
jgi:hypothetical protein